MLWGHQEKAKVPARILGGCMLVPESCFSNTRGELNVCALGFACTVSLMGSLFEQWIPTGGVAWGRLWDLTGTGRSLEVGLSGYSLSPLS